MAFRGDMEEEGAYPTVSYQVPTLAQGIWRRREPILQYPTRYTSSGDMEEEGAYPTVSLQVQYLR